MKFSKYIKPWLATFAHVLIIYLAIKIENEQIIGYLFHYAFDLTNFLALFFPLSLMSVILTIGIYIIVKKQPLTKNPVNKIASAVFAFLLLMGHCFNSIGAFFTIFCYLLPTVLGICYVIGFYLIFRHIFSLIQHHATRISDFFSKKKPLKPYDDHTFLFSWLCMFICWLPYILIRYPAGIEWDAYHQILQFLGIETLTAHWPLGSTVLMGLCIQTGGSLFHSYEAGAMMFVMIQTMVSISIFSYSLVFLKDVGVPSIWRILVLANYSLVPLYPAFFTSIVKDSLFSAVVLLDIILVARKVLLKRKGGFVSITLTSAAMCVLRHNGIHIVLFWLAVMILFFMVKKNRVIIPVMAAMTVTVILFSFYSNILLPAWNIPKGGLQETFSLPFQQTARYLKLHQDDVTEEEREVIGQVLDVDNLAALYDPLLSDPVKGTFHGTKASLMEYFKVWFSQFFKHPITYADAAFHTCYGFFYPDARQSKDRIVGLYLETISDKYIPFHRPDSLIPWIQKLADYAYFWERCPITFPLYNVPLQMWAAIWLAIYGLKKRSLTDMILLMPSIVGILVCIASPTWWGNGFRYCLPVICANPFLLALTQRKG